MPNLEEMETKVISEETQIILQIRSKTSNHWFKKLYKFQDKQGVWWKTGWNIVNLLKTKDREKRLKKSGGKKTHWIQMNNYVNDSWVLSKNDVR